MLVGRFCYTTRSPGLFYYQKFLCWIRKLYIHHCPLGLHHQAAAGLWCHSVLSVGDTETNIIKEISLTPLKPVCALHPVFYLSEEKCP